MSVMCPMCKETQDPDSFTVCAMHVYTCDCGHEIEVNVREAAELFIQMQQRIRHLEAELKRYSPFAGIDL